MKAEARLKLVIRGAVQGVGFRPFVYRLAQSLGLKGWVLNSAQGVFLEVEGAGDNLQTFLRRVETERPPRSFIQSLEASWLDPSGYEGFEIRHADDSGPKTALILADIATCPECLREIFDPADRRHGYAFTNCTNCGPRFSIIEALPYDRSNTSMKRFRMCSRCQAEYDDPVDRRFHAQPNACPECGPRLALWDRSGVEVSDNPLEGAAEAIRGGRIVAVKGLGGFHLVVAAEDETAVRTLRERKRREEKPFALMFEELGAVRRACEVSEAEERLLRSPESPIVLLRRRAGSNSGIQVAPGVAPRNPYLGVMLPGTPLHHLLLARLGGPIVATSGNLSDEPICIDEHEALNRLGSIADLFLVHDRPIVRHVDDSIVRIVGGREMMVRRARGYAPLPVRIGAAEAKLGPALAVGAHLKNTVALAIGPNVFVSQHIGDLETEPANEAFLRVIADLEKLYETRPERIVTDLHPDYVSTRYGQERCRRERIQCERVQHHLAHVCACMAENELAPPVLGVSWDGTGYGTDATVWGGEFFRVSAAAWERFAHLRTFRLPGGEQAVKEPRRSALGLWYELVGPDAFERPDFPLGGSFTAPELKTLRRMLETGVNSPVTSSAGRLFDAVAALLGLRQVVRHEGQAAMDLEFACEGARPHVPCPFAVHQRSEGSHVIDWAPAVLALLEAHQRGDPRGDLALSFHLGLADAIVAVARLAGCERVTLSGGCFQNKILTEAAITRLREVGLRPYWHQRLPPNDGGIALGQIAAVTMFADP